jgi:nucleotide-binding universal stress UspA family protein
MAHLPTVEIKGEKKTSSKELFPLANIMVATDFSPTSERAVDYAVSLGRRFGSRVYVTHIIGYAGHDVMEPNLALPSAEEFRRQAEKNAKELEDSGRLFGVPYEFMIEEGTLWPALQDLIERKSIDLLVLGTHGISGVMKVLTGSSAEAVFRQARIPVLTVGPGAKPEPLFEAEFKTILCATDFGPAAEREAAYAFALAQEHRARLVLLHVSSPKEGLTERDVVYERESIVHTLKELLPTGYELTCQEQFHLAYGEPVAEILKVAQEISADLMVIGAKKRENLAGHIPHTKAYRIVCGAKCPVLTVKS